jgi:hypothetical protein
MFPLKVCGLWYLVYSTNPLFPIRTELKVEYNRMEVAPYKDYGLFKLKRRMKGVLVLKGEGLTKVAWSSKVVNEVETMLLPPLQFPGEVRARQCVLEYNVDPTTSVLEIKEGGHAYVFHRQNPEPERETFYKLLFTQLIVGQILHGLKLFL